MTTVGRQSSLLIKANLRDLQSVLEKLSVGLEFWLLKVERYLIAPSRQTELVRLSTILTFELTCIELTMKNQKNKLFFTAFTHTNSAAVMKGRSYIPLLSTLPEISNSSIFSVPRIYGRWILVVS